MCLQQSINLCISVDKGLFRFYKDVKRYLNDIALFFTNLLADVWFIIFMDEFLKLV